MDHFSGHCENVLFQGGDSQLVVRTLWYCTFWFFFFWAASLDSFRQRKWKLWQRVICPGCAASCLCQQLGASAARGNSFIISHLFILIFIFFFMNQNLWAPSRKHKFLFRNTSHWKVFPLSFPIPPAVNLSFYLVIVGLSATVKHRLCWIICKSKRTKKIKIVDTSP